MRGVLRDAARRVMLACSRAVLRLTDDERKLQTVQVEALKGELLDALEHRQPYGLSSHALPGADVVVLAPGGQRQAAIAIMVSDRRTRPKGIEEGEVILYTAADAEGGRHRVHLKDGRVTRLECGAAYIELTPGAAKIKAPTITLEGATDTWVIP